MLVYLGIELWVDSPLAEAQILQLLLLKATKHEKKSYLSSEAMRLANLHLRHRVAGMPCRVSSPRPSPRPPPPVLTPASPAAAQVLKEPVV